MRERLLIVDLAEDQRALVWRDDRLFDVVGPGRHAYWKQPFALRVETFRESDLRFEHPRLNAVLIDADPESGRARSIQRLSLSADELTALDSTVAQPSVVTAR